MEEKDIFDKCLEKWGLNAQLLMLSEEAIELAHAVLHLVRDKQSVSHLEVAEELVDTELMIAEIKYYIPELESQMKPIRRQKIERLIARLGED